jgi:hypothetical protein
LAFKLAWVLNLRSFATFGPSPFVVCALCHRATRTHDTCSNRDVTRARPLASSLIRKVSGVRQLIGFAKCGPPGPAPRPRHVQRRCDRLGRHAGRRHTHGRVRPIHRVSYLKIPSSTASCYTSCSYCSARVSRLKCMRTSLIGAIYKRWYDKHVDVWKPPIGSMRRHAPTLSSCCRRPRRWPGLPRLWVTR